MIIHLFIFCKLPNYLNINESNSFKRDMVTKSNVEEVKILGRDQKHIVSD
jgi:hypothetical protein